MIFDSKNKEFRPKQLNIVSKSGAAAQLILPLEADLKEEPGMDNLRRKRKIDLKQILEDHWRKRAPIERRSDRDKRITLNLKYFKRGGKERRQLEERRKPSERRDGWMRVGKWRSEAVFDE